MTIPILADATLPDLDIAFPAPFQLDVYYHPDDVSNLLTHHEILLCRSTLKINQALVQNKHLRYIATASSGIDHIDPKISYPIIDAKGANAEAVADYVLSSVAYLQQYTGWVGNKVGIIGLGVVGTVVVRHFTDLQYSVIAYDPWLTSLPIEALFQCDLLCIHANLHQTQPYPSYHLIDQAFLEHIKPHTAIINAARGNIVDEEALLNNKKPLLYCTDVYAHEPFINDKIAQFATLCTPHIAGHTQEAKRDTVRLISKKLHLAYNLAAPVFPPHGVTSMTNTFVSWQEQRLHHYNPIHETNTLKAANNIPECFLTLRNAHIRHRFSVK